MAGVLSVLLGESGIPHPLEQSPKIAVPGSLVHYGEHAVGDSWLDRDGICGFSKSVMIEKSTILTSMPRKFTAELQLHVNSMCGWRLLA